MSRQRVLVTKPGPINSAKLWTEVRAAWANLLDLSDVDAVTLGFDFETPAPTQAQVQTLVNAHDPSPPPPTAEETMFAQSVAQLRATFNTARTAAQINNSIDAITIILRRLYRELQ